MKRNTIDRGILALADTGNADAIRGTEVLETRFEGKCVYRFGARARRKLGE